MDLADGLNAQFFRNSTDNLLLQIFYILSDRSPNNFLVGGCVRDHLLGLTPKDYDIVTDVHMNWIEQDFLENGWEVNATGKAFLVLNVSKDHYQFEIANFRKDGVYSDGRRPESVQIGTIDQDAARRDFTVNALYMDPWKNKLFDPTGKGTDDIVNKTLRFVGKPEQRIREDYLRVFRFYRFLTKGFFPDKRSLQACRRLFNEAYQNTNPERVREEMEKISL